MFHQASVLLIVLLLVLPASAQTRPAIAVKVDPRMELMSIVFRLAGNPEYNMANSKSRYADEVEAHFGAFRDHRAVQLARELRRTRGVSYDAVMSLAAHLDDKLPPGPRTPLRPRPALLESRWTEADAARFIAALRDFVKESDAERFFADHAAFFDQCAARLSALVNRQGILPFFDNYFGARQSGSYTVIVGMLCGGGNYGVSMRHADGREEITPVIGIYKWDAQGLPAIGGEVLDTIFHEFCHAYTNAIVEKHWTAMQASCDALFGRTEAAMRRRAYASGKTLAYETLVRACVSRAMASLSGEGRGRYQALTEACNGFVWTVELSELLKQYEADRKTYPTFEDFMPRIIEKLDALAGDYDAMLRKFPQVVSISPANGDEAVDPATAVLEIVFDRPMRDASWALVTFDRSKFPGLGPPAYDAQRKVLRVPLTLEPGHAYHFGLNGPGFLAFSAEDGYPLMPVEVKFQTRK